MSAHTPGNWEVVSDPCHFDTRTTVVSRDGGSLKGHPYRMTVQVGGWAGPREAEANARLIAAAPCMYDFVRRAAESGDPEATSILEAINGRS